MVDDLAAVWKALADPTRRRLLDRLKDGPWTTGELCTRFPLSRFAVMKHLTILERAGLVIVERHGRERWNYLNAVPIQQIYERLDQRVRRILGHVAPPAEAPGGGTGQHGEEERETMTGEAQAARAVGVMHVEQEVTINAPPARVFDAITKEMAAWWGPPQIIDEERARDVVLEPTLGGRVYEDWGNGEGAIWATVTRIKRGEYLELTGRLGTRGVVLGVIVFSLQPTGQGTVLRLSHRAVGEVTPETEANYTRGWWDLLDRRLRAFVERGERLGLQR